MMEERVGVTEGAGGHVVPTNVNKPGELMDSFCKTPLGLKILGNNDQGDFSGFRENGNMRRVTSMEREMRSMRELISVILEKTRQDGRSSGKVEEGK